ncbi:conserved protein of unknown function [Tepidanaerobacter acetatoxydans Re1]|uniref:Uncharacterized protein n=1 Tax=Tepidanaerobacter acetatoxydans (strain DSM 21804 / JCM 16047 / Re1) TaxID=1209989 RepID=F4LUA3_TEPAE|nr:hypothetical protein [Tepidanaerobacter acetatoxydans]AEE91433.1 hypothetical protein TepRe1_1287 [Tepidanaerobacter acetatoxydans Re1]CDI40673.1 conserved protein of unknown function [Tepidanaerobacter acetatoxydans Re1]
MSHDRYKIFRIIVISIIFLLLMLAFQWYYTKNVMTKTLEKELLQNRYVSNIKIKEGKEKITVDVTFKNVDNLMEAYSTIHGIMEHQLKGRPFELEIVNQANKVISDLYNNEVQFIIYEALQTGKFTEMKARLDEIQYAKTKNTTLEPVEIKVFIDLDNLYLQIKVNESSFYKVISREA